MSTFKIILTSVFGFCIVAGLAVFALSRSSSSSQHADIVVWGTIPLETFSAALQNSSLKASKNISVKYIKKDEATFDSDFTESLAEGNGPDVIILREDSLYKNRNKIFTIPFKNYTERVFRDTFIEGGEIFLAHDGVQALPFLIDPMVMYWNRDMFTNALISQPPQYWDEIPDLINKITKRDSSANVLQSAIALGEWGNITYAKEIISNVLLQAGTPIVARTTNGANSVLNSQFNYPVAPSSSAINFYTQFSNPTSGTYTWNRSLPSSLNFFLSGNLAMYLGFASDIFTIQQKNSNLNFDVITVPQIRNTQKKNVFAHMYALAIVKQSKQISAAFSTISALTEASAINSLLPLTNLPPVRRDLIATKPTDAYRVVFYTSALISHSWLDPDPTRSSRTFRDMIDSITSGQLRISEALTKANEELSAQLR